MIKRIVQMTFDPRHTGAFRQLFEERQDQIRNFEGCTFLELWQDIQEPNIFFTHSTWVSENALNHYRNSAFFKDTWMHTKALFATKAQAWSVAIISEKRD